MSTRTITVTVLALVFGVSAAIGVFQLRARSARAGSGDLVPVVTAADNVGRGQVLDAKMLKINQYQKQNVPTGSFTAIEEVVGRTVIVALVAGEAIVPGKLADKNAGRGLAAMIPDGMRAFTIQTPHVAADVGGFIMPGNCVDVLLTTTQSGQNDATGGGVTTTLLQNVQVLAVAQKMEAPADSNKLIQNDIKAVTLLVLPDQAALLDLGMNRGILHLALRNPGDARQAKTHPATMNDLQFHQEKPLAPRPASPTVAAAAATPQPEAPSYGEIRTLRGLEATWVPISFANGKTTAVAAWRQYGDSRSPKVSFVDDKPPANPSLPPDEQQRLAAVKGEVR